MEHTSYTLHWIDYIKYDQISYRGQEKHFRALKLCGSHAFTGILVPGPMGDPPENLLLKLSALREQQFASLQSLEHLTQQQLNHQLSNRGDELLGALPTAPFFSQKIHRPYCVPVSKLESSKAFAMNSRHWQVIVKKHRDVTLFSSKLEQ